VKLFDHFRHSQAQVSSWNLVFKGLRKESIPEDLDLAGARRPAWQAGGDFYDVCTDNGSRIGLMLADVAGRGLPASLLSSLIQGELRATSWTSHALAHENATRRLNDLLCARSARERYASLIWCYYDASRSALQYVNAGHLPPIVVSRERQETFLVRRLDQAGPILGLLPGSVYRQQTARIGPGDLLVMFSDGITEAASANGQEFGEHRLLTIICENWNCTSRQICAVVLNSIQSFLGNSAAQDDQTLVVMRLLPSRSNPTVARIHPIHPPNRRAYATSA